MDLHSTRPVTMGGAGAIPWSEIDAWQRATGTRLTPIERKLLREIDHSWLAYQATKQR